jgi:hypothetical protein
VLRGVFGLSILLASAAVVAAAAEAAELPTMRAPPPKRAETCHVGGMEGVRTAGGLCVKISGSVSAGVDTGNLKSAPSK